MGIPLTEHLELVYPSKYVKACDLKGKDVTVIVVKCEMEVLTRKGGTRDRKAVLTLASKKGVTLGKQFVANITNLRLIGEAVGSCIMRDWPGKEITLYPTTDKFGRKTVDCIRVRVKTNAAASDIPDDMAQEPESPPADFDVE
jgi:hypothetical protein